MAVKLSRSYLTTAKLNTSFLKIRSANITFLKIKSANTQFMKIGSTAADSSDLGGLSAESYALHIAGAATLADGGSQQLLAMPGGALDVTVTFTLVPGAPAQPVVIVRNNTGQLLPAIQHLQGVDTSANLSQGNNPIDLHSAYQQTNAAQLELQIGPVPGGFGGSFGGASEIVTLIVSVEQAPGKLADATFIGQLIAGAVG